MKFEVMEPSDEQAIVDEPDDYGYARAPGMELPQNVHPKLVSASQRMHRQLENGLTTLDASLHRLGEHIQIAQRREAAETTAAVGATPPASFRASAFSRTRTP